MVGYRLSNNPDIVQRLDDGAWLHRDGAGWAEFEIWTKAGNEPEPVDLAEVIAGRCSEVDALLLQKSAAGVTIAGVPAPVQMRDGDRANVDGQALFATLSKSGALAWPADSAWRLADNSEFAIRTADAMIGFAAQVAAAYLALRKAAWAHKDALKAMATADAVQAYDIMAGW